MALGGRSLPQDAAIWRVDGYKELALFGLQHRARQV